MSDEHKHDHECGCGYDHEEEDNIIVLEDEAGVEHRYYLERILELDEKRYAIMTPEVPEEGEEEGVSYPFRIDTDDEGNEVLVDVDDEEFDKIQEFLENEEFDDVDFDEEDETEE
ncbi:MAG TPA: DUF1292 domain-containing protein [Firmicutes bacterium]|jgi:uncharacterized protein YrzB (UPF0473 family)|nr:DUF1292 domain-containing protein [Bacillota bacterium]HOQ24522.1 DUF1292 domain-containing protein [Bacillota bacterium]HPT67338.1 DUF1292 domain-containing protein [Bacillota bacterium]